MCLLSKVILFHLLDVYGCHELKLRLFTHIYVLEARMLLRKTHWTPECIIQSMIVDTGISSIIVDGVDSVMAFALD